ncbi:hypothetical protein [Natronomonas sp.]|uniref:hypothetical protein n=1 Tax=Natronomonas sp. TaxID=2184060 RepID=UPI002FC3676D
MGRDIRSRVRSEVGSAVESSRSGTPRVHAANRFFPDGYAVWDWETKGFVRSGMMGQVVFETLEDAEEVADEQQLVVELCQPTEGRYLPAVTDGGVEAFDDGSIRFTPPHSKRQAAYRRPGGPDFDPDHERCDSCAHYIPGGGCHLVQGEIDPDAYCEEFYADYGAFGHEHDEFVEVNAEFVGDDFDWEPDDVEEFIDTLDEKLGELVKRR